jgi:transcriptional regulator with XRE-family HTH domain
MRQSPLPHPASACLLAIDHDQAAAMIRGARGILGWSQTELAERTGLTQRSVYKLEQGRVAMRKGTAAAIEQAFHQAGIRFQALGDGTFTILVTASRPLARHEAQPRHAVRHPLPTSAHLQ